jgi:hypothetical protein
LERLGREFSFGLEEGGGGVDVDRFGKGVGNGLIVEGGGAAETAQFFD